MLSKGECDKMYWFDKRIEQEHYKWERQLKIIMLEQEINEMLEIIEKKKEKLRLEKQIHKMWREVQDIEHRISADARK